MAGSGQYTGGSPTAVGYLSTTAFDPLLRDVIAPAITSLINEQFPGFKYFKAKKNDPWEGEGAGRRLLMTLETALNGAVGFIPEGGAIFGAGKGAYSNHELRQKYFYAVMALTGQVMSASKNAKGSLATAFSRETKGVVRRSLLELERGLWGNGTGILCARAAAGGASLTVNLLTTYGSDYPTDTRGIVKGTQVMWGTEAQLAATVAPYCDGYGQVSAVNSATQFTVTLTAGNQPASGDFFVTGGGTATPLTVLPTVAGVYVGNEFMGLRGFGNRYRGTGAPAATTHDPSYLQGLTGAGTMAEWNGQVLDLNAGVATHLLIEDDLIRAADQAWNETGVALNTWFMRTEVRRELLKTLVTDRSFVNTGGVYKGGMAENGVKFNAGYGDIEMVVARLCFPNEIVMLDPSCFWYSWSQPAKWWDADGRVLRMTPGARKDEVEGMYYTYGEMGTKDRRQILRLRDIQTA